MPPPRVCASPLPIGQCTSNLPFIPHKCPMHAWLPKAVQVWKNDQNKAQKQQHFNRPLPVSDHPKNHQKDGCLFAFHWPKNLWSFPSPHFHSNSKFAFCKKNALFGFSCYCCPLGPPSVAIQRRVFLSVPLVLTVEYAKMSAIGFYWDANKVTKIYTNHVALC